jgi:hypothetical protein
MNHDELVGRDLHALNSLRSLASRSAWERRVGERCMAVLAEPPRRSAAPLPRLTDAAVLAAASLYLGAVLTEALRLMAE